MENRSDLRNAMGVTSAHAFACVSQHQRNFGESKDASLDGAILTSPLQICMQLLNKRSRESHWPKWISYQAESHRRLRRRRVRNTCGRVRDCLTQSSSTVQEIPVCGHQSQWVGCIVVRHIQSLIVALLATLGNPRRIAPGDQMGLNLLRREMHAIGCEWVTGGVFE